MILSFASFFGMKTGSSGESIPNRFRRSFVRSRSSSLATNRAAASERVSIVISGVRPCLRLQIGGKEWTRSASETVKICNEGVTA